jgi:hypothetical protein
VTSRDGLPAQSCCLAFGLERVAIAILEHHGLAPHAWPSEVLKLVNDE